MKNLTQEEINKVIKDCKWRDYSGLIDICKGVASPCIAVIEKGKCDTLRKLTTQFFQERLEEYTAEVDRKKYMICCPLCDNPKCVKGTEKCEAEIWKRNKLEEINDGKQKADQPVEQADREV